MAWNFISQNTLKVWYLINIWSGCSDYYEQWHSSQLVIQLSSSVFSKVLCKHTANTPHQKSPQWWVVIISWTEKTRQGLMEPSNNHKPQSMGTLQGTHTGIPRLLPGWNRAAVWQSHHSALQYSGSVWTCLAIHALCRCWIQQAPVSNHRAGALRVPMSKQDLLTNPPMHRHTNTMPHNERARAAMGPTHQHSLMPYAPRWVVEAQPSLYIRRRVASPSFQQQQPPPGWPHPWIMEVMSKQYFQHRGLCTFP